MIGICVNQRNLWLILLIMVALLVACNPVSDAPSSDEEIVEEGQQNITSEQEDSQNSEEEQNPQPEVPSPTAEPDEMPTAEPETQPTEAVEEPTAAPATPTQLPPTEIPATKTAEPEAVSDGEPLDERPEELQLATQGWLTDWEKHTIDYQELLPGGPSRDGIPSLDNPTFVSFAEASGTIGGIEPVIALEINGDARAYPLQILIWHEIVNDMVGDVPVVVTFCPLCNSAIVFDRRVDGQAFEFGTSGLLRYSDLVVYDRSTESLWQQFTGEGIVGEMVGRQLEFLPSSLVSYQDFQDAFPEGVVLSTATGFDRPYGTNPYTGYDTYEHPLSQDGEIALLTIEQDNRLAAADRMIAVSLPEEGIDIAYPLAILSEMGVINDRQGEQDIVVFFQTGTTSALGSQMIVFGDDVGATGVFDPNLEGQKLTFSGDGETITDIETGSEWNIFGQAVSGPLEGESLDPIVHGNHFWFSWAAFKPDTIIYQG